MSNYFRKVNTLLNEIKLEQDLLNQSPELYESRSIDFDRSNSSPQWKNGIPF